MDVIPSGYRDLAVSAAILTTALFSLFGCAEVAPPPGGEVDETSPYVMGSVPPNGAVGVAPGNSVTIRFSERIVKPQARKAIFISPRPEKPPQIKWKSDGVIITFADTFRTDQTYVISVSSDVKDLRNNSLDSASIIAFSTGLTIDSGRVSGYVYGDSRPQSGMMVALYDLQSMDDTIGWDSLYPDYITHSNKDDFFSFEYLPKKEYHLIAFVDQNGSERLDPYREAFALPDRAIVVGGELPLDNLNLPVTRQDTLMPEIISAGFTADGLVRIRLSKPINLESLRQQPSNLTLRLTDDSARVTAARAILEMSQEAASTVHFYTGELGEGVYDLELVVDSAGPAVSHAGMVVKHLEDIRPPTIVAFRPDSRPRLLDRLTVEAFFSEPIDATSVTDETFTLWDRDTSRVPLSYEWLNPFHVQFRSGDLEPGMSCRMVLTEFELLDKAGNALGDSLREYHIVVVDDDSLGAIAGEIAVAIGEKKSDPVVLEFQNVSSNQVYDLSVSGRDFKLDLPAGKYRLTGFIDSDADGKRDLGSVCPYRLSETAASYSDTVSVRARFETAGIVFEFR